MHETVCYRHPDEPTGIVCQRCKRPICHRCMVAGAVGFQCPSCVATGRRETRQGDLPYGGRRSRNPMLTTQILLAINLVIWGLIMATGGGGSPVVNWLAIRVTGFCVLDQSYVVPGNVAACAGDSLVWAPGVGSGAFWQLLTSAFVHVDIVHLAFNMAALFILGPQLERALGRTRFLAIYLISALAGSTLVMWLTEPYSTTLGASGAIFGMMGAVLVLVRKHRGDLRPILVWLGANVVITVFGAASISWQGHLGGLLGGLAVTFAVVGLPAAQRQRWQWPLVGLVALVCLAAIAARMLTLN